MQIKVESNTETNVSLQIVADPEQLKQAHQSVLKRLGRDVQVAGFRKGQAPPNLVEKSIDQTRFQTEFLDEAINHIYVSAITDQKLRPVANPEITIKKVVPFTTLEFEAKVEVIGKIKLANYKTLNLPKPKVSITNKEIEVVVDSLLTRESKREAVKRPSANGDETVIDFKGTDAKTAEAIAGADGKDYPLVLGSNTFIPGFEDHLVGKKAGDKFDFTIKFPSDYGVSALQNRNVKFEVSVKSVNKMVKPTLDDAFVTKVSPFKNVKELKDDVKKQLSAEKQSQADRTYQNQLIEEIAKKSTVKVPKVLVDEQLEKSELEEKQNLMYRGQTWQEHLAEEGVTEEQHRERNRPVAEETVKAGLVLSEIAEAEKIQVTPEEIEIRMQILKGQYQDQQMLAELNKPENMRHIANQIMTEKTFDKLVGYADKPVKNS